MTAPLPLIVVNASTVCTDDEIRHYVAALQMFMPEFCRAWALPEVDVGFMPHGQRIPDGFWVQVVADTSDQAGALGYHETRHNVPIGYTFAKTGRAAGSSVSGTLSHEVWEMLADPYIDLQITEPATGRRWDVENADAVEADEYAIRWPMPSGPDVLLSDFVFPSYFNFSAPEGVAYDYRRLLMQPIPAMLPGGYLAYQEPNGRWGQISAFESRLAAAKARPSPLSRRYRRMFDVWQESELA